jgi:chorismate-pyruvate lyase
MRERSDGMTQAASVSCWLDPLDAFCRLAGRPLPAAQRVEGAAVPEPYRGLLVHQGDMTSRLIAFHRRPIWVRVLTRRQEDAVLLREVALVRDLDQVPVEYGAIRIHLDVLGPQARRHALQCHLPLGSILRQHRIPHVSRPRAFLRVTPDDAIASALELIAPPALYGRCNVLHDATGRTLAEVVEILPPLTRAAPGGTVP